jgi:hypothetical protein
MPLRGRRRELELAGLSRAPAGDERAVVPDGRARLPGPGRGGGIEVLHDHGAAGQALLDRAAEAHLAADNRVAAAGEGERRGRRGHGRFDAAGRRLRNGGRGGDRGEQGDEQHDAGQRQSHFSGAYEVS